MLFEDEEMLDAFSLGELMVEFPYLRIHMETMRRLPQIIQYRSKGKFSRTMNFFGPDAKLDVFSREYY